jgi:hypothetical protein
MPTRAQLDELRRSFAGEIITPGRHALPARGVFTGAAMA